MRCVYQRILTAVSLCHNGNYSQDVSVSVYLHAFLGLQANGIVDRLVTNNLVGTDVHKTYRLTGSDDGGDILIDSKKLHAIHRFLGI